MPFEIQHLGAEHCVTGSCHLLSTYGLHLMIDCGMTQGDDTNLAIADWPISPKDIGLLFLTHAHIDHIGRLPELLEQGFSGDIICSHPTKALLKPLLQDTLRLSGYSKDAARKSLAMIDKLSWGFEYNQKFSLKDDIEFSLGRAGHILGSSFVQFFIPPKNAVQSLVFSGDLGRKNTPILPDPDIPSSCDLLILESTYGDRLHEGGSDRLSQLGDALEHALADGGKVYIPAFSLGRTQEILYELDRLWEDDSWRRRITHNNNSQAISVFVDSPLGLKITDIYKSLSIFWDVEANSLKTNGDNPIDFDHLYSTAHFREHLQLVDIPGPAIIIAGSGMCSGGRIIDHLKHGLSSRKNDIIFVGYQAHGTLGHEIIKQSRKPHGYVVIEREKINVKAKCHVLSGYSAHADQQELIDWVEKIPNGPGCIKLVHGELHAQQSLAKKLEECGYIVDPLSSES